MKFLSLLALVDLQTFFLGSAFILSYSRFASPITASDIKLHFTHAHILLFNTRLVNVDKIMSLEYAREMFYGSFLFF